MSHEQPSKETREICPLCQGNNSYRPWCDLCEGKGTLEPGQNRLWRNPQKAGQDDR